METMALVMAVTIDASFGHSRIPSGILHANGKKKSRLKCAARTTSSEALLARDDLLNLIANEERGLKTQGNSSKCSQITRAIDALAVFGEDSVTTDASSLSATWRMLWTTEKEQLFIVEKAHIFGTKVGDILQAIDVEKGSLNNVITFPPSGAFVVSSTIQVAAPKRVNFRSTFISGFFNFFLGSREAEELRMVKSGSQVQFFEAQIGRFPYLHLVKAGLNHYI